MLAEFFTWTLLLKIAVVFIASIAFAVILKINQRHLLLGGAGAVCTYFIYALMLCVMDSFFAAAFISTAVAVIYAEILARVRKAPAIVYTLVAVIPTVPGGELYFTMRYLITNDISMCMKKLTEALEIGLGIACGLVTASILFGIAFDLYKYAKRRISESK